MRSRTSPLLLSSLVLGACAHAPTQTPLDQNPVKETPAMATPTAPDTAGQDTSPVNPKLTAEQALTRLLELIRSSRFRSDFTPERVNQIMGVEVEQAGDGSGDYSFYEAVTAEFRHGFSSSTKYGRFRFSFNPAIPGTYPEVTDICQPGFEEFSAELEAMGFSKTGNYDSLPPAPPPSFLPDGTPIRVERPSHGRLMSYTFRRIKNGQSEMTVVVHPGRADARTGRTCVRMIEIF